VTDDRDFAALLAEFRSKAEHIGVEIERVATPADAARTLFAWATSVKSSSVTLSSEVRDALPELHPMLAQDGLEVTLASSPEMMRDAPFGVSLARLAVAETGSVLLSEPTLEDRSVGMLTLAQATICPSRALVASLDDAVPLLRERALAPGGSFSTLVTGPSRTADIERVLTVGVQGPGKVMTLFVDDL
jgi:L-lactate dehydrogenase complex protein LldG